MSTELLLIIILASVLTLIGYKWVVHVEEKLAEIKYLDDEIDRLRRSMESRFAKLEGKPEPTQYRTVSFGDL